ncbi:MAG: CRISPR-associated endonuclease/helicase Cas3 [Candidatus Argoarchaeum ethanivorans]|uniref:CRISPR-associated endonuclease/helicase Cas3 n=1 Tax=Candidatus Argoarchaeum ethanivorans TaxID=2608793 RepID=A0A8B3S7N6_9EURY|nr:MAG: CRISPR-associated endonuclease/helicase Cas3 [Candidatus Argoarchaeum ethanivorans]
MNRLIKKILDVDDAYRNILPDGSIYAHQSDMEWAIRDYDNIILSAPCGSGKTVGAIVPWLVTGKRSRLIYVLPTTALLESIESDVKEIIDKLGLKIGIRALGETNTIAIAADYGDRRDSDLLKHNIIFTTLDFFLLRIYRTPLTPSKYRDLTSSRILNSFVVLDEAHMYDEFTLNLAKATLRLLREANVPHLMMTATLTDGLKDFLGIQDQEYHEVKVSDAEWDSFSGTRVIKGIEIYRDVESINLIIKSILDSNCAKSALIVLNTVDTAIGAYDGLKNDFDCTLLHSRFTKEDRRNNLKDAMGKLRTGSGVVISTQVIEAGIDISTPLLITELASGDSLVQRMGRCARRKNETGAVYILRKSDEEDPTVLVHPPYSNESIKSALEVLERGGSELELSRSTPKPDESSKDSKKGVKIALRALTSMYSFSKSILDMQTRSGTPVYIFCGENLKDASGKDKAWQDKQKDCVRVDVRWVWRLGDKLKDMVIYKIDEIGLSNAERTTIRPWDVLSDPIRNSPRSKKKLYEYDNKRGLRKL